MADIALVLAPDGSIDLAIDPARQDFVVDTTLQTAVLLSLACDRQADPGDTFADGTAPTDPRGWCGDAFLPPLPDGTPDRLGSKLWLRARSLATQQTANQIQEDCEASLAWMIADGIAATVKVQTTWLDAISLSVSIAIYQSAGAARPSSTFNFLWNATLGVLLPAQR